MAKSECICKYFSCESSIEKNGNGYVISQNHRFRFVKDDGMITSEIVIDGIVHKSGPCQGDIPSCQIRERKKDRVNFAEEKIELKKKKAIKKEKAEKKKKIIKKNKRS